MTKFKIKLPAKDKQKEEKKVKPKRKAERKDKELVLLETEENASDVAVVKRQKTEDIGKRYPLLNLRTSPKPLYEAIQRLSQEQKQCIEDMGFGRLLSMKTDGVPGKMAFAILDNFDTDAMQIKFGEKTIQVNEQSIHDILGLPMGEVDFLNCQYLDDDNVAVKNWKSQFKSSKVRPNEIKKKIIETDEADYHFKVNFLTLMYNTLGECNLSGTCNLSMINFIQPETTVSNINWCKHIYSCLVDSKGRWHKENPNSFYAGPITYLIVSMLISMH